MWIGRKEFEALKKRVMQNEEENILLRNQLSEHGLIPIHVCCGLNKSVRVPPYPVVENTKLLLKHFNLEVQETPSEKKLVKIKKGKK